MVAQYNKGQPYLSTFYHKPTSQVLTSVGIESNCLLTVASLFRESWSEFSKQGLPTARVKESTEPM